MSDPGVLVAIAANGSMPAYIIEGVTTAAPGSVTGAPQMHRQPRLGDTNQ